MKRTNQTRITCLEKTLPLKKHLKAFNISELLWDFACYVTHIFTLRNLKSGLLIVLTVIVYEAILKMKPLPDIQTLLFLFSLMRVALTNKVFIAFTHCRFEAITAVWPYLHAVYLYIGVVWDTRPLLWPQVCWTETKSRIVFWCWGLAVNIGCWSAFLVLCHRFRQNLPTNSLHYAGVFRTCWWEQPPVRI